MLLEFFNIMSSAQIGKRIDCMGEIGTIKYIGTVQGHPASWLGIDWDNPQRGKHNGTVNDVIYFEATYPKSGSFVRPEKVNFGISAVEAITSRYGQKDDEITSKINEQQLLTVQKTINAPFLQLVGFDKVADKQSNFASLEVVNLRLQNVSSGGHPMELYKICPNIKELDISKNLFNDWTTIFDICSQLQELKWLNVSENLLVMPKDYENYTFPNVQVLICANMRLTWNEVLKLSKIFPNVEELRVPSNYITDIHIPNGNTFKCLKLLDLESNSIGQWSILNKLGNLPELEHLIVEDSNLQDIKFIGEEPKIKEFSNLKKLVLSKNNISDWNSIQELNRLQSLEDLRILKNPVLEKENYNTCVQLFIARIANLKFLNGSEIETGERRGAEYDYLKKYGMEWLSVMKTKTSERDAFLSNHKRFLELIDLYGTPEESEMKIQSHLIKVSLVDVSLEYNDRIVSKKLPPTLLIQKLIMMVQRMFNLNNRPNLLYVSGNVEIELDDEGKELGFYSIQSGDKIVIKT